MDCIILIVWIGVLVTVAVDPLFAEVGIPSRKLNICLVYAPIFCVELVGNGYPAMVIDSYMYRLIIKYCCNTLIGCSLMI